MYNADNYHTHWQDCLLCWQLYALQSRYVFLPCFLLLIIRHLKLGMKVYITEEKELIMEPALKWAGNPNIIVAVKAFGLKATVQVLGHLTFDGKGAIDPR